MKYGKFLDKFVAVFFWDGESVKRKEGKLLEISPENITLLETGKTLFIPMNRIVRIETQNGGRRSV